jgi:hypothetical protein
MYSQGCGGSSPFDGTKNSDYQLRSRICARWLSCSSSVLQSPLAQRLARSRLLSVPFGAYLTPLPEGGFGYSGWDEKELVRYGDASAVAVSKVIDGKELSRDEIRQILLIIQTSFEAPLQGKIKSDRHPRAATVPVANLERMPAPSGRAEEFAGTKKFLKRVSTEKTRRGRGSLAGCDA